MEDNIRWFHNPSKCHPMHIVQCTVYTIYTQNIHNIHNIYTIYIIYTQYTHNIYKIHTMYTQYTQHLSRQCTLHSPSKCHPLHKLNSIVYHLSLFADTTSKCHYTASSYHMYQTPFSDNTPLQDIKVSPTRQSVASAPVYVPVPWTSHICACSLCNATHKFCALFQQKDSACIHLTVDPWTFGATSVF